jgi:Domain of unknown function (DUF4386)
MPYGLADLPPRVKARTAGVFYLFTFVAGSLALLVHSSIGSAAGLIAAVSYVAVTVLFYDLLKPVNVSLSLVAAIVSLTGIIAGPLGLGIRALVLFGIYCLLIGYLIFRSTFLPRTLGAPMAVAGLGWLTFLSVPLSESLFAYNLAPGIVGEGALTLWFLIVGVDVRRWHEQADTARLHTRTA